MCRSDASIYCNMIAKVELTPLSGLGEWETCYVRVHINLPLVDE